MTIHREGHRLLFIMAAAITGVTALAMWFLPQYTALHWALISVGLVLFLIVLQFFRMPVKRTVVNDKHVIAPADGKVVVIEETDEPEYLKDRRIQVSIFMSPINVHSNHNPVSGVFSFFKYHPGKFLVAWHPKSSTENERTTTVIRMPNGGPEILFRQIAGALAKRIVWYVKEGARAEQGKEFGFIKFGSRVDIFLPLGTEIKVKLGDKTTGAETVIAELN